MIYFANSLQNQINWEQAYNQILQNYLQMSKCYNDSIANQETLENKIQELAKINENLLNQIKENEEKKLVKVVSTSTLVDEESLEQITVKKPSRRLRRIRRRNGKRKIFSQAIEHKCTYDDCDKTYSSSVSMNLHIKLKHNGGTKKQREAFAKQILDAEEKGTLPPKMKITLPPNFLEEFKTSYAYIKKYSM